MGYEQFDTEAVKNSIIGKIGRYFGCRLEDATDVQLYKAVAMTVRDRIMEKWVASRADLSRAKPRKLYYLSIEFLTGRALDNNILSLCQTEPYQKALLELGIDLKRIEECEPEPGLGNGGLGRLAACFMDSLATLHMPATGCSIRYEYGLFRQRIVEGNQVELPDNWLDDGNVWEIAYPEDEVEVRFGGHIEEDWSSGVPVPHLVDYHSVLAVPYDMPVVGLNSDVVDSLRLWSARSPKRIDMIQFSRGEYARAMEEKELAEVISKVLYPEDQHYEGKELRLKQHYFLSSATVQYIIAEYKKMHGPDLRHLADQVVIHINDTHPGLAIPELIRILVDEEGLTFDEAEDIARHTFAYTNHTVMAEALERWSEAMVKIQLPRIHQILVELNERWCKRLWTYYPGQWEKIGSMAILAYDQVHMANLCIALSFSVNGVSQLHAEILKHDTFADFYVVEPSKFIGITNGITHRRWLLQANPGLAALIRDAIGDGFISDPSELQKLLKLRDDAGFRERFQQVKLGNKQRLADYVKRTQNQIINPNTLFDVQAKRLHEYKRQLLNALHILYLYNRIADDPGFTVVPRTYIFAAKAAPGYYRAKQIIRLVHAIAALVEKHPRAKELINVIFLENYCVSVAEILMPAAELSEQLSTAGKEASGTGNMKFMMNGAVTIGTLDGANVEIRDVVGNENIYIFGLRAEEVDQLYRHGTYHAGDEYEKKPELRRLMEQLIDGTLAGDRAFSELYHALLFGDGGGMADPYLVLKDFSSYARAQARVDADYVNAALWTRKAIANTATSGFFSSDRTIHEYNELIWHLPELTPVFQGMNSHAANRT